jgi:Polyketide cyclase / dehydrase and lipid transport
MPSLRVFEQTIEINAAVWAIEFCLADLPTLHRWLNPALRCQPLAPAADGSITPSLPLNHPIWSLDRGSRSRFIIQIPLLAPSLESIVVDRQPGLVVWEFSGFFQGRDRWECQPLEAQPAGSLAGSPAPRTRLLNRFEFTIPQPVVAWGFNQFAATWTQRDMRSQLQRFKQVAEDIQSMRS